MLLATTRALHTHETVLEPPAAQVDLDYVAAEVTEIVADDLAGGGVVEAVRLELRHPLLGATVAEPVGATRPAEHPS